MDSNALANHLSCPTFHNIPLFDCQTTIVWHELYLLSSGRICSLKCPCNPDAASWEDASTTGEGGIHLFNVAEDGDAVTEVHGFEP